jgi:tetratricopeptide (TPR) repeat protein
MVKPLEKAIVDQVYAEMREGYARLKDGKPDEAEQHFLRAWALIPEPKLGWDISQITVIRIAKVYRSLKKFLEALRWARDVFKCKPLPGDAEPYILLGSIHFEAGELDAAREHFQKAFDLAGKRGFEGEDPAYLKFLKEKKKA